MTLDVVILPDLELGTATLNYLRSRKLERENQFENLVLQMPNRCTIGPELFMSDTIDF